MHGHARGRQFTSTACMGLHNIIIYNFTHTKALKSTQISASIFTVPSAFSKMRFDFCDRSARTVSQELTNCAWAPLNRAINIDRDSTANELFIVDLSSTSTIQGWNKFSSLVTSLGTLVRRVSATIFYTGNSTLRPQLTTRFLQPISVDYSMVGRKRHTQIRQY